MKPGGNEPPSRARRRWSWRTKLLVLLCAFSLAPTAVLSYWAMRNLSSQAERNALQRIDGLAKTRAQALDQFVNDRVRQVERIAMLLAPDMTVLTRAKTESPAAVAVRRGAQDYLVKGSLDADRLARCLRHAIERSRVLQALHASNLQLRRLIESNIDGNVVVDDAGVICLVNVAAASLFGRSRDELVGAPFGFPVVGGEDAEIELVSKSRRAITVELRVVEIDWEGAPARLASLRDITERKRMEQELQQAAAELEQANRILETASSTDPLTGVLNRRGLDEALQREQARAARAGEQLTSLLIDCDDFKSINERHGHVAGDLVLKEIARRITETARATDIVARIGGDEFLVVLTDGHFWDAARVADRIRLSISSTPIDHDGAPIEVTVSTGACRIPMGDTSIKSVIESNQLSLQRSKERGKNIVTFIDEEVHRPRMENLVDVLRDPGSYHAVSQKIVRISDGAVVGHELQVRTSIEDLELPEDILSFASEENVLSLVDTIALKTCCARAATMDKAVPIYVNVLPSTLMELVQTSFIVYLYDLDLLHRLCLEISCEQAVGDIEGLRGAIARLRGTGIRIAADRVNFGRQSLESLIFIKPDVVKIHGGLLRGARDRRFLEHSLSRLVKAMSISGASVIAKDIETQEELQIIRDAGIEYAQGNLWEAPACATPTIR